MRRVIFKYLFLSLTSVLLFVPMLTSCFQTDINLPLPNTNEIVTDQNIGESDNGSTDQIKPVLPSPEGNEIVKPDENVGSEKVPSPQLPDGSGDKDKTPTLPPEPETKPETKPVEPQLPDENKDKEKLPVTPEPDKVIGENSNGSNIVNKLKIEIPSTAVKMSKLREPIIHSVDDLYGSGKHGNEYDAEEAKKLVLKTESEFKEYQNSKNYIEWYKKEFDYQAYLLKYYNFDCFPKDYIKDSAIYVTKKTQTSIAYEMQAQFGKKTEFMLYAPYDDSHQTGQKITVPIGTLVKINLEFNIPSINMIKFPFSHSDLIYPWSVHTATLSSWDPINHKTGHLKSMVFGGQFDISAGFFEKTRDSSIRFSVSTKTDSNGSWLNEFDQSTKLRLKLLSLNRKTIRF